MKKALAACLAAGLLTGCYSFRGPGPALDSYGIVPHDNFNDRVGPLFQRFIAATAIASGCNIEPSDVLSPRSRPRMLRTANSDRLNVNCLDGTPPTDLVEQRLFPNTSDDLGRTTRDVQLRRMGNYMRAGYALVRADCINYFAVMGRNQARSRIARGTIGPILNLISGVLSLRNVDMSEGSDAITITALASATATSGLDIFDENFLFGSDNIAIVEDLVIRSMGEHAERTLTSASRPATFEEASTNIIQHQSLCRPPGILRMVRTSIQDAAPQAAQTPSPPPPATPPPPPKEQVSTSQRTQEDTLRSTSINVRASGPPSNR